jgi:hypothetical protein
LSEGQVRGRDIHRNDASVGQAAPQLKSAAAGAAADIEHRAIAGQLGEVDQDLRETAGPAPDKALVGCAIGATGLSRLISRSQP